MWYNRDFWKNVILEAYVCLKITQNVAEFLLSNVDLVKRSILHDITQETGYIFSIWVIPCQFENLGFSTKKS
jgi:hypothetical protein